MVQRALETVEVQQFAVPSRCLTPTLDAAADPNGAYDSHTESDSSCDSVSRRCTFHIQQDDQATGAGRSEDSRDPSSLTRQ